MPWRLKEVIPEALKKAGGKEKLKRGLVLAAWREVVGRELAQLSEPLALEGGALTVRVADPVTAHQLTYSRLALLRRYEERFPGVVKEIRFVVGPLEKEPETPKTPENPERLLWASRRALELSEKAPLELREKVARAALALLQKDRGEPCPICGSPSPKHPCPTCRRLLESPWVRKEAERLKRGRPTGLEGEALLVARHLARQSLLSEMEALYPQALRDETLRPLLRDLAQRFRTLFPGETLPEAVRSLLAKEA
ncbi:hypothetical protein CSW14_06115 [Thermus scotoductus]|uniref:DUF721 domain-containing protein n=1 Tax=Thermus scotoductus TaxID=37636 RepID=A0A430VSM0_THESC|nr:DUF721 domain-containing protein [Thermus scotoductus]RTI02965.1 hypothetical protein CSW29_01470 [Thermus scotoductus]RTI56496.1 hypothetical protein CSW14_06115 [Thermus scotoductus]